MKHLNSVDAAFLHMESAEMPLHVGSLYVCDPPAGGAKDFFRAVKRHIASRLHLAPVFRRKLAFVPLDLANPMWVEDADLRIDDHIRRVVLPKPGTTAELEACVARLHAERLDRSRPLWQLYVVEGLASGQVAIYSKVHHAGLDGAAAAALAASMLDTSPEPREVAPPPRRRRSEHRDPGVVEIAEAAISNLASQYVKLVKLVPGAARAVSSVVLPSKGGGGEEGSSSSLPKWLEFGPKTPLNVTVSRERAFVGLALALDRAKRVAKHFEVTLNDVVLAVCSGALRRYLEDRGALPSKSLVALMPVSIRRGGDEEQNNQFTLALASLASDVADPAERLRAISASSAKAKGFTRRVKSAIPMDLPSLAMPWWMGGLALLYEWSRLADALPPVANVLISNVPGPQFPLYVAGAEVKSDFPVSVLYHGLALNITVKSYNGSLDFGLTACPRAVPDVGRVAELLGEALAELEALVPASAPKPKARRAPRTRR
jgi:WS/DGAT/MGAT family acyltransferase